MATNDSPLQIAALRSLSLELGQGGGGEPDPEVTILEQSDFSALAAPSNWVVSTQAGGAIDFSGGFSRGTYPVTQGNAASHVNISVPVPDGVDDIYIQFRARMPGNMGGCKFCKVQGRDSDPSGYANATFGTEAGAGTMTRVLYGDGTGAINDATNIVNFSGTGHAVGRASATAVVDAPQGDVFGGASGWGSEWHDFRIRCKFNGGNTPETEVADGEFYVEIDGLVYMHATGLLNRNVQNGPIEKVVFYNAAQNDPQSFIIDFDDIVLSTGGFA